LHGHRYVADVTINADSLDDLGMVVDFGDIKQVIGDWIDLHWDHSMLLNPDDPLLTAVLPPDWKAVFGPKEPYIMPKGMNPTAENIAMLLSREAQKLISKNGQGLRVSRVRVYETPNCWADY
jgi:6-pyruvoyltetrahydropterin/6-carboxytetrahydropterin synthase